VSGDLYKAYLDWCEKNLERPYAQRMFGIHLQNIGVGKDRTKTARYWTGIGMREWGCWENEKVNFDDLPLGDRRGWREKC